MKRHFSSRHLFRGSYAITKRSSASHSRKGSAKDELRPSLSLFMGCRWFGPTCCVGCLPEKL